MRASITEKELMSAVHPTEDSRFTLALIVCLPAIIVIFIFLFEEWGYATFILIGLLVFIFWLSGTVLKYSLIGNSVRVTSKNFPEVHSVAEEIKTLLNYNKDLPIFIIEEGTINAFIAKFFNNKFIILNSRLVEAMSKPENIIQLKWVIARFIGSLKVKQFRDEFLMYLIDAIDDAVILSFFILPYKRATQYSGDNMGLLVCEDIDQVMIAFHSFMVGKHLARNVNFEGLLEQGVDIQGNFFAFIARIGATHPHTVSRYLNLLAFSEKMFPHEFEKFTNTFDYSANRKIGALLPTYYR